MHCPKLGGLKRLRCSFLRFRRSEAWHGSHWQKNQSVGRLCWVEAPRETEFPCFFQILGAACIPWLVVMSTFKASSDPLSICPAAPLWSLLALSHVLLNSPSFTSKDLDDYTGLTQIIHDNVPTVRSADEQLNFTYNHNLSLPRKETFLGSSD